MQSSQPPTRINIIYATETSTSYDLAKQFVLSNNNKLTINKFIDIAEIESFEREQNSLWIFFISTTGQGDFSYSMRSLWKKMLSKSHAMLDWMKFSIFSLGDRSYGDNFCMAGRKLRQRLISLKAEQVVEIGLGDEQQANGFFTEYRQKWLPNLMNYFSKVHLISQKSSQSKDEIKLLQRNFPSQPFSDYRLKLIEREQICQNKDRRVFTVSLQVVGYPHNVQLGDVLSIYPHNNPQHVKYLMKHFNLTQTDIYSPKQTRNQESKQKITKQPSLTYKQLFTSHLNISSTLNHSFFISRSDLPDLNTYCSNELFKQKLVQLEKDYQQYHNYIKKYKRNVIEVLQDFQLTLLPVNQFVLRCGNVFARKYSVAGVVESQEKDKKIVKILFKLVKTEINSVRIHQGLCSHDMGMWMDINQTRRGTIIKGEFNYNQKPKNNLIFITLGTGVAPFMQFFDHAKHSQNQWNLMVFFTNRYQNENYFQTQLEHLTQENKLNPFLSFTGEGGKRIIRVLEDNAQAIRDLIAEHGIEHIKIMVCGPKEVCQGVQNILGRELGVDVKVLKKKKIFIYQNW